MKENLETNLQEEIISLLENIASFAKDPSGGVTRLVYSKQWVDTQHAIREMMNNKGLITSFDAVGNLFGKIEGTCFKDETILTGSHVDTVRNGGIYDGQFGIVAGMLAIELLNKKYGPPLRNIEVVSFSEEEGSRFPYSYWGSKNLIGIAKKADVENIEDKDGIKFVSAMKESGFDFEKEDKKIRDDYKNFVEVHIEQGNVLENEHLDLGIVNAIVGIKRFTVCVAGVANHAGTTPMKYRKDAFYATSKMVTSIIERAKEKGDPLVATVGTIDIKPNTVNVIPGEAKFNFDIRHTDSNSLEAFSHEAICIIEKIAKENHVDVKIDMWMDVAPIPMDDDLVNKLQNICIKSNKNYKIMHSGAGHDAQVMAEAISTVMIFVPSKEGVSHSPYEYTSPEKLEEGIEVLCKILYELAYI